MRLLGELFDRVYLPPAVNAELGRSLPNSPPVDLSPFEFVEVLAPADVNAVRAADPTLHAGEVEAIALCLEIRAKSLLIDERRGRRVARLMGLDLLGVLGVLLRGKELGHIDEVAPLIDRLRDELEFRVSDGLRDRVVRLAGET